MNKYYEILESDPNDSHESIKKSFRRLSFKYHPDYNNGNDDMFKKLNEAWSYVDKNHNKKQQVDYKNGGKNYGNNSVEFHNTTLNLNLFEVYNGLELSFSFKVVDEIESINIVESPRCINFNLKRVLRKGKDGKIHIIYFKYNIITSSTSTVQISVGENGYDLILKVLVKTDDNIIFTPLKDVTIKNEFPYVKVIKNKGLYKHTESGISNGDLIVDNSINEKEVLPVETKNNLGGFLFWLTFIILLIHLLQQLT